MKNPKNERLHLRSESTSHSGEFTIINDTLIFSMNNSMCEAEISSIKFYLSDKGFVNNFADGDFLGYLVSGEIDLFENGNANQNNVKFGSLDNLQSDLVFALKSPS